MVKNAEEIALQSRDKFIENGEASFFQWLGSKGTNYTCYVQYLEGLTEQQYMNKKIDIIRTIIYALQCPFTFTYFYWTILVFILHKFNFKKPIMRLILYHFILRTLGDIFNKLGDLYGNYFATNVHYERAEPYFDCQNYAMHPLKWFLSRQISIVLWYTGEIFGDWYPLLRTQAVVKNKLIYVVYVACGIFNLSKISLILLHLNYNPAKMYDHYGAYDNNKSTKFYNYYYINQFAIIFTSVIYDIAVYIVLKKSIFNKNNTFELGFLKKFKNLSEYRILISSLFSIVFLPIISVTIILKLYYSHKNLNALDFSFEDTRLMITSVPYYMIFIDQILLLRFRDQTKNSTSNTTSNYIGSSNTYLNTGTMSKNKYNLGMEGNETLKYNDNKDKDNYYNNNSRTNINISNYNNLNHNNSNGNSISNINSTYYLNMLNSDSEKNPLQYNIFNNNNYNNYNNYNDDNGWK